MENSNKGKTLARKRFFMESLIILLLIGTPFIFKLHEIFPTEPNATISFLGLEFTSNGFQDLSVYVWFLLGKAIPLFLLTIWFFTCKHWWYHIILIPLCMYAFQIFEVIFSQDDNYVDTENLLWLLPLCMIIIPFVYLIRIKLFDKYVHGIDLNALNAELDFYKSKGIQKLNDSIIEDEFTQTTSALDLSDETPKRTLHQIFSGLRMSLRSLF
jgi:glucan phosphoethanolaminetransferase (alkaline phosphatase superfamily)